MKESIEQNTFTIATASHLDLATIYSVAWPVSEHLNISRRAGYSGVELWPQRFGPSFEVRFDLLSQNEKRGIVSVHQSPISLDRGKPKISQVQAALLLPELNRSLNSLENVRDQVGDVPAVLFREAPISYMTESDFSYKQIQTDPETAEAWGIRNDDSRIAAREYIEKARLNLFDGIVIDTHHLRRRNTKTGEKNPFLDWRESIPEFLPYCKEIHIGVGRLDYPDMAESASTELDDLLNGGYKNTEVVQMLRFIADYNWKGIIVVEFRPSSVKQEYNRKLVLSSGDLISAYSRMRETLFNIFE